MSVAWDHENGVHSVGIKVKHSRNNNAVEPIDRDTTNGTHDKPIIEGSLPPIQTDMHRPSTDIDAAHLTRTTSGSTTVWTTNLAPVWTTKRNGAVVIRRQPGDTFDSITVPELIKRTVDKFPNGIALAVKRNGEWIKWTYAQYHKEIYIAAKSFIHLGLEPYNGVGIIGFNSPEWVLANMGCIYACGLSSGIYTTNSPEACHFVAENCRANVIVVENDQQLQKILKVKDKLPHLKAIVQYTGDVTAPNRQNFIYTWSEFMELGKSVPDSALKERMDMLEPNKCCVLIYTSGTTGNPKGVMLSHDNITFTAQSTRKGVSEQVALQFGDVSMVSYLPLSHVAAQMLDLYVLANFGGTLYFAQPDALKGSLGATLKEVRPHVFLGVPRVWEKMQESMMNVARNAPSIKRKISRWAKGVGYKTHYSLMNGGSPAFGYGLANKLVFQKVKAALGFDRCIIRLSGAAPITKETLEFFLSLDLPICEVYGMSECSGPHTTALPPMNRVCSAGKELPFITTRLDKPDKDGNGEVLMIGRHVFMGYLGEEEKTKEVFDSDGALHSGDIGRKDKDGFLFITGRIKELIITAGGENIPPVKIEDLVKEALPCISQCMLIGDRKKFLSMLLTMKVEVNTDTMEPSDRLTPSSLDWVRSVGSTATTVSAILEPGDEKVLGAIQKGINSVNAKATSNAQCIQKWSLLAKDFSIPGGELGPTMKLRRPIIQKMYTKTIDGFYEADGS